MKAPNIMQSVPTLLAVGALAFGLASTSAQAQSSTNDFKQVTPSAPQFIDGTKRLDPGHWDDHPGYRDDWRNRDRRKDKLLRLAARLENRADHFRHEVDDFLDHSYLDGSEREDRINRFVGDFAYLADRIERRVRDGRRIDYDVRALVDDGKRIDSAIQRMNIPYGLRSLWHEVREDIRLFERHYRY